MTVAWAIHRFARIDSTMSVAAGMAVAGARAGTVVVAEEQTAGRGQLGRAWLAPPGTCLLFTVIARPPLAVAQRPDLSRAIAAGVAEALAAIASVRPAIKAPNDLLLDGRKLAGILCQTSIRGDVLEYLLIGIGLNVNIPATELPLPTATSLLAATGRDHDREALLCAILERLATMPGLLEVAGPDVD